MDLNDARAPQRNRWGQERRLDFVEFRLLWEGRFNRADLVDFFGVSMPQASADVAEYMRQAPSNVVYDSSEKLFRPTEHFQPVRSSGASESYLLQLLTYHTEGPARGTSFIGWLPPYDVVAAPKRVVSPSTLIEVLRAIRSKSCVEIEYQSFSRPDPLRRWITPTALVNDEFRWHVRAWCHLRERFADFTFGRILEFYGSKPQHGELPEDEEWNTYVHLIVAPNPQLNPAKRRALELDYDMKDGVLDLRCRRALVYYLIRKLRLDEPDSTPETSRHLVWINKTEVNATTSTVAGYTSDRVGRS